MRFLALPELAKGLVTMTASGVFVINIYGLLWIFRCRSRRKETAFAVHAFLAVIMTLASFVLAQILTMVLQRDLVLPFDIPLLPILVLTAIPFIFVIYLYIRIAKWQKEHLTAVSVKEAFDRLPMGLMIYTRDGIPIMINEAMDSFARELTGEPLTDAMAFRKQLGSMTTTGKDIQSGDPAVVRSKNGRVLSLIRNPIDAGKRGMYELTAVDITREYEMTAELEKRRDLARVLNSRLKALLGTIEYVTMNRELLQLKTALHDNIGQSILIAKRYLYSPGSVDKERMLEFWKDNIRHLTNDEPEEWELPYYVISKEADLLGIRLVIIGELPHEQNLIPIVDAAISIHIGNILKHANGTEAVIEVKENAEEILLTFTNDGKAPEGVITEKGGLLNLRSMVEDAGGSMEVRSDPAFSMRLSFPKAKKI